MAVATMALIPAPASWLVWVSSSSVSRVSSLPSSDTILKVVKIDTAFHETQVLGEKPQSNFLLLFTKDTEGKIK